MRWFILAATVPLLAMNGVVAASEIKPVHSEKCLDVPNDSAAPDIQIIQFTCHSGPNQQWSVQTAGDTSTIVAHNGMCLDVRGGSTGDIVPIIQFPCSGGFNQKFRVINVPGVAPGDSRVQIKTFADKCLDIDSGSLFDTAGVIQFTCTGRPNQIFHIQ